MAVKGSEVADQQKIWLQQGNNTAVISNLFWHHFKAPDDKQGRQLNDTPFCLTCHDHRKSEELFARLSLSSKQQCFPSVGGVLWAREGERERRRESASVLHWLGTYTDRGPNSLPLSSWILLLSAYCWGLNQDTNIKRKVGHSLDLWGDRGEKTKPNKTKQNPCFWWFKFKHQLV